MGMKTIQENQTNYFMHFYSWISEQCINILPI